MLYVTIGCLVVAIIGLIWLYHCMWKDIKELMALIGDAYIANERLKRELQGLCNSHNFLLEAVKINMELTEKCYLLTQALEKIYKQRLPKGNKVN